jgi:hypothetical protein
VSPFHREALVKSSSSADAFPLELVLNMIKIASQAQTFNIQFLALDALKNLINQAFMLDNIGYVEMILNQGYLKML